MGLGMQLIAWPGALSEGMVDRVFPVPTLTLRGTDDSPVPVAGGVDTVDHIRDDLLGIIASAGYDIARGLVSILVDVTAEPCLAGRSR